jgi:hypothetical protein
VAAATLAQAAAAAAGAGNGGTGANSTHNQIFILAPSFECADVEAVRRFAQQACERDGAFVRLVAMGKGDATDAADADPPPEKRDAARQAWLRQRLGTERVSYESADLTALGGPPGAAEYLAQAFLRDLVLRPPAMGPRPVRLLVGGGGGGSSTAPPLTLDLWHAPHLLLTMPSSAPLPGACPDVVIAAAAGAEGGGDNESSSHLLLFGGRVGVRLKGGAAAAAAFVSSGDSDNNTNPILLRCEGVVPRSRVAPETLVGGPWLLVPATAGGGVAAEALPRPVLRGDAGGGGGDGGALEVEMACDDEEAGGGDEGDEAARASAAAAAAAAASAQAAAAAALAARLRAGGLVLLASSRSPALGCGGGRSDLPSAMAPAVYCLEPASAGGGALVARRVAPREALVPLPACVAASAAAGEGGDEAAAASAAAAMVERALEGLVEKEDEEGVGEGVVLPTSGLHDFMERLLWRERTGGVRLVAAAVAPPAAPVAVPAAAPPPPSAAPVATAAAEPPQQQQAPRPTATTTTTTAPRRASKRVGALPLGPASGRGAG